MAYIFYILELLCPSYQTMGLQAPVEAYKSSYYYRNSTASFKTEMDYNGAVECLSKSLYFEAKEKAQGKTGYILVGLVILNRVRHNEYHNDICSVVKAKNSFSWYWDGKSDKPKEMDRYKLAQIIAKDLIAGKYSGKLPSSVTFFKKCDTYSQFFSKLRVYGSHGTHCFYYQPRKNKESKL